MPFSERIPHPFKTDAIRVYAPDAEGVYGISNAREWIFIGQTDSIQKAHLAHLENASVSLMKWKPTGFVYELCSGDFRSARQDRLVQEYEPTCNRSAGRRL